MKKAILLFFLVISSLSFSQSFHGVLKDRETKELLKGVHITSSGIKFNTISSETEEFRIHLKQNVSPKDSISITFVGYEKSTHKSGKFKS